MGAIRRATRPGGAVAVDVEYGAGIDNGRGFTGALAALRGLGVGVYHRLVLIPFFPALLAATGAALLATLFSISPARSWLFMGLWASYLVAFGLAYWKPESARALLRYALVAVSTLVLADRLTFGGRPDTWINPNAAASLLLLLLPWVTKAASLPMLLGLAALAVTGSRGAWWAWIVALGVLIARPKFYIAVPLAAVVAAILLTMRPSTAAVRFEVWQEAVNLFKESWITGWGPGTYSLLAVVEPGKVHPDSLPFWIMAEQGMFSFMAWSVLIANIIEKIARPGTPARLALTAWGLHQVFDCTLGYLPVGLTAALCLALLARNVESYGTSTSGT